MRVAAAAPGGEPTQAAPRAAGDLRHAALVLAVVLGAFAPVVAGTRTLAQGDTHRFFASLRPLVVEALRAGRLPLWNPYEGAGKPLFAEGVHSVLHPVSLAGALLAPQSMDALVLGYLALAALGAYALARRLGASPPAAAGAGLAFALSGFSVSMTANLVFLAGLSSLPWLLAAARAAGEGWRWGPAATALAVACAFFAGDAQSALVGLGLGLLLAAEAGGRRGALRALLGVGAGLLLAGVQLAATRELLPQTHRSLELPEADRVMWALSPSRLLEWVVPGLMRGPLAVRPVDGAGRTLELQFADSVHLGAPLLAAAALALGPGRRRVALLLAGGAAALAWLALGHHLGAQQALAWVPIWGRFRYTEKLMGPLGLVVAALAALGVEAFAARPMGRPWRWSVSALALLAGAGLLTLRVAPEATSALAVRLGGAAGTFHRATLAAGLPYPLAGLLALLAADRLRRPAARGAALAALLAGSALAAVPFGALPGDPAARVVPPPRLAGDGPVPRLIGAGEGTDHAEWGLPFPDTSARTVSLNLVPSANAAVRLDALDLYCAFSPRRFFQVEAVFGPERARGYRRFGLTHVLVPLPVNLIDREAAARAVEGGRLVERDVALGRELWEVPHRPWAFFAAGAVAAPGRAEAGRALAALAEAGRDGVVVVESPTRPPTSPGQVLSFERQPEVVRLDAVAAGPALLVVQDAFWPGWRAAVDGRPAELLAADVLVRAVPLPPGRHRVELTYRPPALDLGLALTGLGAALVAALAVAAAWPRRPG